MFLQKAVFVNSCFCAIIVFGTEVLALAGLCRATTIYAQEHQVCIWCGRPQRDRPYEHIATQNPRGPYACSSLTMMAEEQENSPTNGEPRRCPNCNTRVATKATTCLMCGASLVVAEEPPTEEEETKRHIPSWVGSVIVFVLALMIVAAGGFGLYTMLTAAPELEEATPKIAPTRTPTATWTSVPVQQPTPTSTSTPIPPRVHEVQEGQTLSDIAVSYDITIEQILALNPEVDPELIQVGEVLLIPADAATPGPANAAESGDSTPTPEDFVVHVVESGETLISIAEQYGISVSLLRTANDLAADEESIQPEQSLVIPLSTLTPTLTPTKDPNATPTPQPPYAAPPLLGPPDGAIFEDPEAAVLLQWASVSVLEGDEWYELTLSQPPGGIVSDTVRIRATAWRVPPELLLKANAEVREFRWKVQVVREAQEDEESSYQEAGASSETRTFIWLEPTPTSTPRPTPTP